MPVSRLTKQELEHIETMRDMEKNLAEAVTPKTKQSIEKEKRSNFLDLLFVLGLFAFLGAVLAHFLGF